jgi:hypothetical protein
LHSNTSDCERIRIYKIGGHAQALAFIYCEDEPGRRATGKLLTRDEARRIAVNIAKLPLLRR